MEQPSSTRILWIVAVAAEATPIIKLFQLKKNVDFHPYPLYSSSDRKHALIVSGIGKTTSAAAASLAIYHTRPSLICNIGIAAAHPSLQAQLGQLYQVDKVLDSGSHFEHFLHPILKGSWDKATIECLDKPLLLQDTAHYQSHLFDMESAGIIAAAKPFLNNTNTHIFKVISDFGLDSSKPIFTADSVAQLIEPHLLSVSNYLSQTLEHLAELKEPTQPEPSIISAIPWTSSEQEQLRQLFRQWEAWRRLRPNHIPEQNKQLQAYTKKLLETTYEFPKNKRRKCLKEITELLDPTRFFHDLH